MNRSVDPGAHHMAHYDLCGPRDYVATASRDEVYCRLSYYDEDFIVLPHEAWPVGVPEAEFRLDRPR